MNTRPRHFGVYETRRVRSSTASLERSITGENTDETAVTFSRGSASVTSVASTNFELVVRTVDLGALISFLQELPSNESVQEVENACQGESPLETALS
jgi:hypothetical protein